MKTRSYLSPTLFAGAILINLYLFYSNVSLYSAKGNHQTFFSQRQAALRELQKNAAKETKQQTIATLNNLTHKVVRMESFPEIISRIDHLMDQKSLYREDVTYRKMDDNKLFNVIRIDLSLTGNYENFRRFLEEIERDQNILWATSIQAFQEKTALRFRLQIDVLVKE